MHIPHKSRPSAAAFLLLAVWCVIPVRVVFAQPLTTRPAPTVYRHAAVAADHAVASQAGLEILKAGGNAVDAAVAASFCLSVVRPYSCGIGGGGFMLIWKPARERAAPVMVAVNYRERAAAVVGRDYYVRLADRTESRTGHRAVGVPGTVAGLLWAHEHYGSLERAVVMGPAIRAAEQGFRADTNHVAAARRLQERFERSGGAPQYAGPIWTDLCLDGRVAPGDFISNPDQARALKLIARDGADAFYRGEIAEAIVATMQAHGGPIRKGDLSGYAVSVVAPLKGSFRGLNVLTMPPPSSGGIAMLQILGVLDRRLEDLGEIGHNQPPYVHLLVEAMKHAFADRAAWLADPAFVDVPTHKLLDAEYLDRVAASISLSKTNGPLHYGSSESGSDDGGTSHISVIDASGMAVACTETINLVYGSLVVVPGFGFALNNQMDDFTTIPGEPNAFGLRQSNRNLPEPGKRPLSSMAPTIVLDNGRAIIIAGGSGGPRIITATLQSILNCLLFKMTARQAISAARFHHQWMPDVLQFEDRWQDASSVLVLKRLGHTTGRRDEVGVVQLIHIRSDGIDAASDPRKGGAPAGY